MTVQVDLSLILFYLFAHCHCKANPMVDQPEFHKSFSFNGVLLVVFNALFLDLLIIGYGGKSDTNQMGDLLTKLTIGAFLEGALVVFIGFVTYTIIFKEPLIWLLSKFYFLVVLSRIVSDPFWRVGYEGKWEKRPVQLARRNYEEFCRYQLSDDPGSPRWSAQQHLAVATFFIFILSFVSPLLGFQSIGYRLLPPILTEIGVATNYHWLAGAVLVIAICYICSNGMLALFGDHRDNFTAYYNRRANSKLIEIIDELLSGHLDVINDLREEASKSNRPTLPIALRQMPESLQEIASSLEIVDLGLKDLRRRIVDSPDADHSSIWRGLKKMLEEPADEND